MAGSPVKPSWGWLKVLWIMSNDCKPHGFANGFAITCRQQKLHEALTSGPNSPYPEKWQSSEFPATSSDFFFLEGTLQIPFASHFFAYNFEGNSKDFQDPPEERWLLYLNACQGISFDSH